MNDNEPEAKGKRADMLNRIVRPIPSMRPLFGGKDQMDRQLLRAAVKGFASTKGIDYEEAHVILLARAEKIGFESPDVTPDYLLTPKQIYSRGKTRTQINRRREMKAKFVEGDGDLDGKGESPDPNPPFDHDAHEKSGGHRR